MVNKTKHIGLIAVLIICSIVLISGLSIFVKFNLDKKSTANQTKLANGATKVTLTASYQNPFETKSQYENPFSDYQNPIDDLAFATQ